MRLEQHECNTSATRTRRVQHKCCTNDREAARVENFDFVNNVSENIFSHSYISYIPNERLQG